MLDVVTAPAATRTLRFRPSGIETHPEFVVYMNAGCHICRSEGFQAATRVQVKTPERTLIATLNIVHGAMLSIDEVSLSLAAQHALGLSGGEALSFAQMPWLESLSDVRAKVYGQSLDRAAFGRIINDAVAGRYDDLHLAAFVAACAGSRLDLQETIALTDAMVCAGERLSWGRTPVMDKHCVGGLPGNRTTPIVVAIVTACGLLMPKTSSRAITSPAGTADTMAVLAPVDLDIQSIRRVVERTGGCIVWGGAVQLSPADDVLIRIERPLDLDSEGQLVASVLSKKLAAGSSHVLIDVPVGPTAKVRDALSAQRLVHRLVEVGQALGLHVAAAISDGLQPVGRGIGPALEARDVLQVLQRDPQAPADLLERSLSLAARVLELAGHVALGAGRALAQQVLAEGRAWRQFQAICEAQGGLLQPPVAPLQRVVRARHAGVVQRIDNRVLARIAKLAGAPQGPAAGLDLHVHLGHEVERGQPLFTLHAEAPGEMDYAWDYALAHPGVIELQARDAE